MNILRKGDKVKFIDVEDSEYTSSIFTGTVVEILAGAWYDWVTVHWDADFTTTIHIDRLDIIESKPWEKYNSAYSSI